VSCVRGTLLRWGREVCDGRLDVRTCARCTLEQHAAGPLGSFALGSIPPRMGAGLGRLGLAGGAWTALRMPELIAARHAALRALLSEVDQVVVLCRWTQDLLELNGVSPHKVTLCRLGLAGLPATAHAPRPRSSGPLRIAFLGRFHPTKGPDLLIRAVRELPRLPLELHLFGITQSARDSAYHHQLERLAGDDRRIAFFPPVPNGQIVQLLRAGYNVLAVPSRGLEGGPLVLLEAFAAGVPVIGARLGGIAELVSDEVDGLLVKPDSVTAWREALSRVAQDRALLARLESSVRLPRSMGTVAEEILSLYARLTPAAQRMEAAR
jgi:glycosyltransferase involved in cell wall biosynthesis